MERVLWKFLLTLMGCIVAYIISYALLSAGPEQSYRINKSRFGEFRYPKYKSVDRVRVARMTAFYRPLYYADCLVFRRESWKSQSSRFFYTPIK